MASPATIGPVSVEMLPATTYLLPNEPVWRFEEGERQGVDGKGYYRWQTWLVVRDDRLAMFAENIGPRAAFPKASRGFCIPAMGVHSVAEIRDMAPALREKPADVLDFEANRTGRNFLRNAEETATKRWDARHRRTVLGPRIKRQNG